MKNSLNMNKSDNKIEAKESISDKEQTWIRVFWCEYKPNFSYEKVFSDLKSEFYDNGNWILRKFDDDKERFQELFQMLKNNQFRMDIKFLESLSDTQKNYLSLLFLDYIIDDLGAELENGKSLLVWMCRWELKNYIDNYFDRRKLEKITKNFKDFNLTYFRQAEDCLHRAWDKNIHHIIKEYILIKNINNDIDSPEINKLNLWENFSLWALHTKSVMSFWREQTWWKKELDKNGNETQFEDEWEKSVYDEHLHSYYYILDRNHPSSYKDASWVLYTQYLDSPTWIGLFYKNRPIACISFYIKNWNELFINQIQKIPYYEYDRYGRCTWKHYSSITNDIDWENILYNVAKNLAKKYNISRIVIQWWDNNERTKKIYEDYQTNYFKNKVSLLNQPIPSKNKGRIHLHPQIAKKIYDVFAEWLWFHQNNDWNRETEI